jgi:hypothetical protein
MVVSNQQVIPGLAAAVSGADEVQDATPGPAVELDTRTATVGFRHDVDADALALVRP